MRWSRLRSAPGRSWRALAPWVLVACTDYRLEEEPEPGVATLVVTPDAVAITGACADTTADVTFTSVGSVAVEITDLSLDGEGWALPPIPLPLVLDPRQSEGVTLAAGPGEATLHVSSTDAATPVVDMPLSLVVNHHPTARVTAPYEDQQVPADGVLVLEGVVGDDDGPLDQLAVTWTSSLVGTVGTSVPDSAGRVRFEWGAEDRRSGPQTIQVLATDPCGDIGETTLYFCQDGPWAYDALSFSAWTEAGAAAWSEAGLTLGGVAESSGAMFAASEILDAGELSATITFEADGVNGLALVLLDADRRVTYLGGDGCGLGYGGGADCAEGDPLPGWAVELDLVEDPEVDRAPAPTLAFTVDGDIAAPRLEAPLAELEGGEHTLSVDIRAPRVTVSLDGALVLDADVPDSLDFRGVLGVTTSTGELAGEVRVSVAEFTDLDCD